MTAGFADAAHQVGAAARPSPRSQGSPEAETRSSANSILRLDIGDCTAWTGKADRSALRRR